MKIPDYNKKIKQPTYLEMQQEIERLQSVIKEVRETIEKESFTYEHITGDYRAIESDLILEILGGENNDK